MEQTVGGCLCVYAGTLLVGALHNVPTRHVLDVDVTVRHLLMGATLNIHIRRLPQSHTCFNTLDLPCYPTKALLKQKLMMAIAGSDGFGLA